jgi:anhydro-N-acetylmuramic acid kinase
MSGIDVAAADLRLGDGTVELTALGHRSTAYPAGLRDALLARTGTVDGLCRLDTEVGQALALAAGDLLAELDPAAALVASSGQTVHHWVEGGRCLGSLQLGGPAWIAEHTGLPVVAGLPAGDVAAGGHAVPLSAVLDSLWLAGGEKPVAALDLGALATLTVVSPGAPTVAFATGPGTTLLDAAARLVSNGVWQLDVDGELAAQGSERPDLLAALLADAYYVTRPPKSAGTDRFTATYLRTALDGVPHVAAVDLLATLVELTAVTVAEACRAHGVRKVVASGGGVRNPVLMAALARTLGPTPLVVSDELGIPAGAKGAYVAALLGFLTWHGIPANSPAATGADGPRLLGSITPGRTPIRLPEPATEPLTGLRVRAKEPLRAGARRP